MIEPQVKRGTHVESYTGERLIVWRLYYFTNENWSIPMTWTCDTKREALYHAFEHQWIRIGGAIAGLSEREVGLWIAASEWLSVTGTVKP